MANLNYNDIIKDIANKKFYPVYILMGEETYFIDKIIDALEENVIDPADKDFNFTVLYGADVDAQTVVTAAQRFPMMAPLQMVMLKEAQSMFHAKAQLDLLEGYVKSPSPSTVLVISYKGDKLGATSDLLKAAAKNTKNVVVFNSAKFKDYQLPGLVKDYCKANNIKIDNKAVEMLCEFVGTSLSKLFSEVEKLKIALDDPKSIISPELIEKIVGYSKDFNNFELTNALELRDYKKAVRIVKYFEENPKQNPTVVTTGTLFSFFQKLVIANFTADKSDSSLMKALGLKSAYSLKGIRNGLRSYNAMQSLRSISLIREFDTKSKGIGSLQKEYNLLLELIFKLCTL